MEKLQELKDQNVLLEHKNQAIVIKDKEKEEKIKKMENLGQLTNTLKDMKQLITSSLIRQQDVNSEN